MTIDALLAESVPPEAGGQGVTLDPDQAEWLCRYLGADGRVLLICAHDPEPNHELRGTGRLSTMHAYPSVGLGFLEPRAFDVVLIDGTKVSSGHWDVAIAAFNCTKPGGVLALTGFPPPTLASLKAQPIIARRVEAVYDGFGELHLRRTS